MSNWDSQHYLKYGNERTRAASDLVTRINLPSPKLIADLGCGPGNSTRLLRERWPAAEVVGVDNSREMLASANRELTSVCWQLDDLATWEPERDFELLFSNAALQWLPDHAHLVSRLFGFVSSGGALAFQIPSANYALIRTLMHEVSRHPDWNDRMEAPRNALTMEEPGFYYDALIGHSKQIDLWETEYLHVMPSIESLIDWMSSTGLRPFLAAVGDKDERELFLSRLRTALAKEYVHRCDGKVLFPFRRTFVIAYR